MTQLTELQCDALGEIFNIGVGRAASSLSQIVNDEVLLSAPAVLVVPREKAAELLLGKEFRQFSSVSQNFSGPFDAQAMLIFPEVNALEIVRLMVGPHMSIEELSEFEQEAMCEVGNIILNACMSSLADLPHQFDSTYPSTGSVTPIR
jgi:chemotaxis protein CheC